MVLYMEKYNFAKEDGDLAFRISNREGTCHLHEMLIRCSTFPLRKCYNRENSYRLRVILCIKTSYSLGIGIIGFRVGIINLVHI